MNRLLFRTTALFLFLTLLILPAAAYEIPEDFSGLTLEDVMADFMEDWGLNSENFAVSYYNTVTGESYAFNDTHMMVAASTFKLPLNLYYYDLEHAGELDPDAYIDGAGTTLSDAHYQSLVFSNNEVSIGLLYNLGDFRTYKNLMRKYFTMTDEEIEYIYFVDNYYCTRMMLDALTYLYNNSADFEEMLGYMKEAQPGEHFKAGVPEEYEVAHKYGWFEGAVNDVGIIYTPEPFLLAVYTQDVGADVVAEAASLFTAYNVANTQPEEAEEPVEPEDPDGTIHLEIEEVPLEEVPVPEEIVTEPESETTPVEEPTPAPEEERAATSTLPWWIPAAGGLVLVLLVVYIIGSSRKRRR